MDLWIEIILKIHIAIRVCQYYDHRRIASDSHACTQKLPTPSVATSFACLCTAADTSVASDSHMSVPHHPKGGGGGVKYFYILLWGPLYYSILFYSYIYNNKYKLLSYIPNPRPPTAGSSPAELVQ